MRLATQSDPALWVKDNHSIVFSDFYIEQGEQFVLMEGNDTLPPGRVTVSGAKFEILDKAQKEIVSVKGYRGALAIGPHQFYPSGRFPVFEQTGGGPFDVLLWANAFYNTGVRMDSQGGGVRLHGWGNVYVGDPSSPKRTPDTIKDTPLSHESAELMQSVIDDFRRLGAVEMKLLRQWQ